MAPSARCDTSKNDAFISSVREQYPSRTAISDEQFDALVTECDRQRHDLEALQEEFLSLASHQLRTPITAINWYLEMILYDEKDSLTPRVHEYMQQMYQTSKRMSSLINDILNAARLEAGKVVFHMQRTDVGAMMLEVMQDVEPLLKERRATVNMHVKEGAYHAHVDPTMARQVLQNLITNAIRYGGKPGQSPHITITLDEVDTQPERFVRVCVKDQGIGIPDEARERLFEKFFRADNAIQHVTDGSGLGLYIVKMVVESWGGEVRVQSAENKGSTFCVTMPVEFDGSDTSVSSGHV